ncbi:uncharacterized protein LOC141580586 [Saimiri boliviensis]|uniref:uncharacterized protein LOC141580586 n=1 Tax=Saimiri boliviensis TaxID=27679 RepID=UPI003D78A213
MSFPLTVERESLYVSQAGLKFLRSSDPPSLASQSAGIIGADLPTESLSSPTRRKHFAELSICICLMVKFSLFQIVTPEPLCKENVIWGMRRTIVYGTERTFSWMYYPDFKDVLASPLPFAMIESFLRPPHPCFLYNLWNCTWMNLETIILSKLTQEQKTKCHIFSLVSGRRTMRTHGHRRDVGSGVDWQDHAEHDTTQGARLRPWSQACWSALLNLRHCPQGKLMDACSGPLVVNAEKLQEPAIWREKCVPAAGANKDLRKVKSYFELLG